MSTSSFASLSRDIQKIGRALEHLTKDVLQNPAVLVVGDFERSVDASDGCEMFFFAGGVAGAHFHFFAGLEIAGQAFNFEGFEACEAECFGSFAGEEFERQDAHAYQVRAMDTFETFGEDGANAKEY